MIAFITGFPDSIGRCQRREGVMKTSAMRCAVPCRKKELILLGAWLHAGPKKLSTNYVGLYIDVWADLVDHQSSLGSRGEDNLIPKVAVEFRTLVVIIMSQSLTVRLLISSSWPQSTGDLCYVLWHCWHQFLLFQATRVSVVRRDPVPT